MENKKTIIFIGVLLVVMAVLGSKSSSLEKSSKIIKTIPLNLEKLEKKDEELIDLNLYLPNKTFDGLMNKVVKIKYTEDKNEVIQEVIKNISLELKNNEQLKDELVLLNTFFNEKDLYLNLKETKELNADSKETLYIIYSITNTLVDLGGVERVKIMLNNKKEEGLFKSYYKKTNNL
ncbi:MAG: GerMN domain-containing protein [Fusobacteriaceae bacterium]